MSNNNKCRVLLLCWLMFGVQCKKILDFTLITEIKDTLENALDYIDANMYRSAVDCAFGVAFVKAFMRTSYKNGSHIMDQYSLCILTKCNQILKKSEMIFAQNDDNRNNDWKLKYLIMDDIWTKNIDYKPSKALEIMDDDPNIIAKSYVRHLIFDEETEADSCIFEIINSTIARQKVYMQCSVSSHCWSTFFKNANGYGYYLTHKLLLLLIVKAKKCLVNMHYYENQVKSICAAINYDATYFTSLHDDHFDLFLEQILLCGYEGFSEFIRNDWLFRILKAQHKSGCFKDNVYDSYKSRMKRDSVQFENGCNDHTTTLGAAVLGLYYNYIVNREDVEF